MIDLINSTVSDLQSDLEADTYTSEALIKTACESANDSKEAFITVDSAAAIDAASVSDRIRIASGPRSRLEGIPVAIKDVINTASLRTTMASNQFRQNIPTADAAVVKALREAGAVIVGKTNAQEFSYGIRGDTGAFNAVANPHDSTRIAGGSSSGSAVAVATGVVPIAVGTDTAGSIRVPAALCGVVGFKPSLGLIDDAGVFPLSPSFDTVGYFGSCVKDIQLVLENTHALPPAAEFKVHSTALSITALTDLRSSVDEQVVGIPFDIARTALKAKDSGMPELDGRVVDFLGIYDPIRSYEAYTVHRELLEASPDLYQPQTLDRLLAGNQVSEAELGNAHDRMLAAQVLFMEAFSDTDIILSPTVPITAPSSTDKAPLISKKLMSFCVPWNVLGWPALTVPCSVEDLGLPQSIQVIGKPGTDALVLQVGMLIEKIFSSYNLK